MNIKPILKYTRLVILLSSNVFSIQPDPSLKVRNASQAVDMILAFLRKQTNNIPGAGVKWVEKTIHAAGIQDYAINSKLFT